MSDRLNGPPYTERELRLIATYNAKVEDFAAETRRATALQSAITQIESDRQSDVRSLLDESLNKDSTIAHLRGVIEEALTYLRGQGGEHFVAFDAAAAFNGVLAILAKAEEPHDGTL
jgi:hypothetical protein